MAPAMVASLLYRCQHRENTQCIITHVAAMASGLYSHVFRFPGIILVVNLHGVLICLWGQNWMGDLEYGIAKISIGSS